MGCTDTSASAAAEQREEQPESFDGEAAATAAVGTIEKEIERSIKELDKIKDKYCKQIDAIKQNAQRRRQELQEEEDIKNKGKNSTHKP